MMLKFTKEQLKTTVLCLPLSQGGLNTPFLPFAVAKLGPDKLMR
jgi:hypothetical protein